jgi:hypothetical protein
VTGLWRSLPLACGILVFSGCAAPPPPAPPPPERAAAGAADPARQAVLSAAYVFGDTGRVAGRPAAAARAAADLEWMAVGLAQDQGWIGATPILFMRLAEARAELRDLLGIAADAPPEVVIGRLLGAAAALDAGHPAEAEAGLGARAVARLGALPQLPRAAHATQLAQAEMVRIMQGDPE